MIDPRMGGDPYGMLQGHGGMAGGMGGMMDYGLAGGNSGFDTAMGIILGGGSRRGRCRRC